jgi:hypothetical protein
MQQTDAEKDRHDHVIAASGNADLAADVQADGLVDDLRQRLMRGTCHSALFLMRLADQTFALGGNHRALHDARDRGDEFTAASPFMSFPPQTSAICSNFILYESFHIFRSSGGYLFFKNFSISSTKRNFA